MYKQNKPTKTLIVRNESYEAEGIEMKIERLFKNGEPISDTAPLIYQERKEGVEPAYNIKADRFDIAMEAMDKGSRSYRATREDRHKPKDKIENKIESKSESKSDPKGTPGANSPS